MTNAARALARRLNNTAPKQDTVNDPAAIAFARRLQQRGIVSEVSGLPPEVDPDDERERIARQRLVEHIDEILYAPERRKAEAEEAMPQTAAGVLAAALAQANNASPQHVPLNGAAVLRAALAGGSGTINGQNG